MAAGVVANELGLELYRVDLSQLISKYIGETQKNIGRTLDRVFGAAAACCSSTRATLFARRSDASDAQDRYSNAEIAYLLQRTEQYDGIILLATNLLQNFDEAFRRRIGFMVHFTLPDEASACGSGARRSRPRPRPARWTSRCWPRSWSCPARASAAAVHAAYLAAAEHGDITMDRVIRAARREYEKEGKAFPPRLDAMFPAERSF